MLPEPAQGQCSSERPAPAPVLPFPAAVLCTSVTSVFSLFRHRLSLSGFPHLHSLGLGRAVLSSPHPTRGISSQGSSAQLRHEMKPHFHKTDFKFRDIHQDS